jgi:protein TonB
MVVTAPAEPLLSPSPGYPLLARHLRAEGRVDVTVLVDAEGFPATLSSENGAPVLRQAALDAATAWRFKPALQNGKPVPGTFHITFEFKLPPGSARI